MEGAVTRSWRSTLPMVVTVGALVALYGVIAWWTPDQDADWLARVADHRDPIGPAMLGRYILNSHGTTPEIIALLLAVVRPIHVIATPIACVALLVAAHTLVERRLPSWKRPDDALAIATMSALIWIGAPMAGQVFFYRPYCALYLYSMTLVLWLAVPYALAGSQPSPARREERAS